LILCLESTADPSHSVASEMSVSTAAPLIAVTAMASSYFATRWMYARLDADFASRQSVPVLAGFARDSSSLVDALLGLFWEQMGALSALPLSPPVLPSAMPTVHMILSRELSRPSSATSVVCSASSKWASFVKPSV
jgi:hypothetical protein